MDKPLCRLCNRHHWTNEGHTWPDDDSKRKAVKEIAKSLPVKPASELISVNNVNINKPDVNSLQANKDTDVNINKANKEPDVNMLTVNKRIDEIVLTINKLTERLDRLECKPVLDRKEYMRSYMKNRRMDAGKDKR